MNRQTTFLDGHGEKAAKALTERLRKAASEGDVVLTLPGGSSVQPMYEAIPSVGERVAWEHVHVFMTDERVVPLSDERSNFKLAWDLFLEDLSSNHGLPKENIHAFEYADDVHDAVDAYQDELDGVGNHVSVAVLGVGGDGHIGSIFPGGAVVESNRKEYHLVTDSPKPPAERITISPSHVQDADHTMLFFLGERKRDAFKAFSDPSTPVTACPARLGLQGDEENEAIIVTDLAEKMNV